MWTDISQFDIPEHQKTASYGSGKEDNFTDIGEVCVVNSMFGKAKVRVMHPRKKRGLLWPVASLAATGIAVIFWLEQDTPKPPEPMRIIVRSVDSEGTVQASSQQLQGTPTTLNKAPPPAVPVNPQASPGPNARTVIAKPMVSQPAMPPVASKPAMSVPAEPSSIPVKPPSTPLAAGSIQMKNTAAVQPAAKLPATSQPAAAQAFAPAMKNENHVTAPVAEPLPENDTKAVMPSSNAAQPDQTSTQPN